jgi:serine/threonine protein phosphatase PrpC
MPRDADHDEPVLVHAGLDVFRPHRRQPDLSSARSGKKNQAAHADDDTHVGWLLRNGKISEREARTHPRRNVLQKALGGGNQFVDPQVGAVAYERGDIFLLCTDGLVEGLYDRQLVDLLRPDKTAGMVSDPAHVLVEESAATTPPHWWCDLNPSVLNFSGAADNTTCAGEC